MSTRKNRVKTMSFEIVTGNANYDVRATPFTIATGETRFRVSINDNPVTIFGWDNGLNRLARLDDASPMTGNLEMAIADTLNKNVRAMQKAA
jgi:hypothetical protein